LNCFVFGCLLRFLSYNSKFPAHLEIYYSIKTSGMKIYLILPVFFLFTVACNNSNQQNDKDVQADQQHQAEESLPKVDENELVARLSVDMVAVEKTQKDKDRNLILNYTMDNLLDVKGTPSGLYYWITKEGNGALITKEDRLKVHYRGYFMDGKEFDSSYKRNRPLEFKIGQMIAGWNEGLLYMKPGAKAIFLVPSDLAYGPGGFKDRKGNTLIPANEVLVFELEVMEVL